MQKIPTNATLRRLGPSSKADAAATLPAQGFTLVELTVVLVIVALLLGGLMMPLAAQRDHELTTTTQRSMREAIDALGGFAVIRNRLPCPAPSALADEAPQGGHCAAQAGFFPAVSVGVPGNDAWGRPYRYAVATQAWNTDTPTTKYADIPTTPDALLSLPVPLEKLRTDLGACSARSQYAVVVFGETLNCPVGLWIIGDKIPGVIWSDGPDPTTTADDLVTWLAWPILAGQIARLP